MTERRPPPSLGTYRPIQDRADAPSGPRRPAAPRPGSDQPVPQAPQRSDDPRSARRFQQPSDQRSATPPPLRHEQSLQHSLDELTEPLWVPPDEMPRIVTSRVRASPPPPTHPARKRPAAPPSPAAEPEGTSGLKILLYSTFGLFAFLAAAIVAAYILVPTNLIRDRLQMEVKNRTGRDLVIGGSTSLSMWPRPSVAVRDVTLSAPPEMGGAPLLRVAELEVSVQILPLLLHDVTVDRLVLRRPEFDLRIDVNGNRSWQFTALELPVPMQRIRLAQFAAGGQKALPKELQQFMKGSTDPSQRPANPPGTSRIGDISLGNVRIVDGVVHYRDARDSADETVTALNAQLTLANIASPLDVTADFSWRGEPVQTTARISPFRALMDGRPIESHITATAQPLNVKFDGVMTLGADIDVDGQVNLEAKALDRLARWTGRQFTGSLPGGLSIDGKLKQTATVTAFNNARITLGGLSGTGTLSVNTSGQRPYVKGAVHVATLDLGMLRALTESAAVTQGGGVAPATGSAQPAPAVVPTGAPTSIEDLLRAPPGQSSAPQLKPQLRGFTKRDGWSDDAIDFSPFGLADADMRVGFDRIVWQDLQSGGGQVSVALKSKNARISLEDVQLYEGRAHGIVTIDATATDALVGANLVSEGVSALPFLKAMSGFDWLAGKTRIAVAVAGRGATEHQIVSTLNGRADISITDGSLIGLNFGSIVAGLAKRKPGMLERSPDEKTDFSDFGASTRIANGIARNDDLHMTSAELKATGAGTIDLPQRTMDYTLKPKMTAGLGAGVEVPLHIAGPIDKPTVSPQGVDANQIVKAVQDAARTPQGREVQQTINGVLNGDPAANAKVKNFFDQLLGK